MKRKDMTDSLQYDQTSEEKRHDGFVAVRSNISCLVSSALPFTDGFQCS